MNHKNPKKKQKRGKRGRRGPACRSRPSHGRSGWRRGAPPRRGWLDPRPIRSEGAARGTTSPISLSLTPALKFSIWTLAFIGWNVYKNPLLGFLKISICTLTLMGEFFENPLFGWTCSFPRVINILNLKN